MSIEDFNEFFRIAKPSVVLSDHEFVKYLIVRYSISIVTLRRWRRLGKDAIFKQKYINCATCNRLIYRTTSKQLVCSNKCLNKHKYALLLERIRLGLRDKPKKSPQSYDVSRKKRENRKISSKLSDKSIKGKPYSAFEKQAISNYKKTAFELSMEIGRSVSSIERMRSIIKKKSL